MIRPRHIMMSLKRAQNKKVMDKKYLGKFQISFDKHLALKRLAEQEVLS